MLESPLTGIASEIVKSSTYFQYENGDFNLRSLTIMRNRIGPNLVPRGTPAVTLSHWETSLLSFTRWRRSVRKLHIHDIMEGRTPKAMNFCMTRKWLIRSKAFEKASTHALRYFPGSSRADNQLWIRSRRH